MATIKPFANSIWPNALKTDTEGYVIFYPLGTNKVDINTVKWPKGDKLITPFLYEGEEDKLVGFVDTESLISGENSTIYLPYNHIEIQFPSIEKGTLQIHAPNATTKKASWSDDVFEDIPEAQFKYKGCKTVDDINVINSDYQTTDIVDGVWSEPLWDLENGKDMFLYCENLTTFSADISGLTDGTDMFRGCLELSSFDSDLSELKNGTSMFSGCEKLIPFSIDMPKLEKGRSMFYECGFTSFSSDLSGLKDGTAMFHSCSNLTSFSSDLSSLTEGNGMFNVCSNLVSFDSALPSLTNGYQMFDYCKLNAQSVVNIMESLPKRERWAALFMGFGCDDNESDKLLFAQECNCETWDILIEKFSAKKWTVEIQCNGRPTSTYGLRRGEKLPVYTKLEEVTDEKYYNYTSIDGSKKYNIHYFHSTNGSTEGFDVFSSLEEAISTYNVTPKN